MSVVEEEFEQRYVANPPAPVQVWVYCRLCRCRIQVRTIARPDLPFRCFCGTSGTFARFDVFTAEDEVVRFATTFEQLYQETKALMREAAIPMPQTRMYTPDEMRRLKAGEDLEADRDADEPEAEDELLPRARPAVDDAATFQRRARELTEAVQRAADGLPRHEALSEVGRYAFAHRALHADARRLCYQACSRDAALARHTLRDATARHRRGEGVKLRFPLFKRYIALLVEDGQPEKALEVALHAVSLGVPNLDGHVARLRAQVGG